MHINKDLEGLIMSTKSIKDFYNAAMEQEKFSPEFWYELRKISTEKGLKSFIEEKVQPVAKEMGYNFSTEELLSYEEKVAKEITERQLEAVSGGVNVKNLALGGIISLMALGAGIIGTTSFTSAAGPESGSSITIRNNSIQAAKSWYGNWLYLTTDSDSLDGLHLDYSDFLKFSKTAGFKNASEVQAIQARNVNGDMLKITLDEDLKSDFSESQEVPGKLWGSWGIANIKREKIEENYGSKDKYAQEVANFEVIRSGNNNEVKLLIKDKCEKNVTIPSKVHDKNGKELKVVDWGVKVKYKTHKIYDKNGKEVHSYVVKKRNKTLETLKFDGDFDSLEFKGSDISKLSSLKNIEFTGKVKNLTIREDAFREGELEIFKMPKNVETLIIENGAFFNFYCESFQMPESVGTLDVRESAFDNFSVEGDKFSMPQSVTNLSLGKYSFLDDCLENIAMPKNVVNLTIDEEAFYDGSQSITMPDKVTKLTIGKNAFGFRRKDAARDIILTIPNNIKEIHLDEDAFAEESMVNELILPKTLENQVPQKVKDTVDITFY